MKSLFLTFRPIYEESGISKKIIAQYNAFRSLGFDMKLCKMVIEKSGNYTYVIDDKVVSNLGKGVKAKLSLYTKYKEIAEYVKQQNIKFVYIRYVLNATPSFLRFLSDLKESGAVLFLEIPTYPYDKELQNCIVSKIQLLVEKRCRGYFRKYIDRIITYTDLSHIYGVPCVNISNSVDINSIRLRHPKPHKGFVMVGVAQLAPWHGYDRIIRGISEYYKKGGKERVVFYIIGNGAKFIKEYQELASELNVADHVYCEGMKSGGELDEYFDVADFAIGCLACHRKNVYKVKSLKNVEYASRGIPFIYSEINDDFDDQSYVLKEAADESPVDINRIIGFVNSLTQKPAEIRESIEDCLTWDAQMYKVTCALKEIENEK